MELRDTGCEMELRVHTIPHPEIGTPNPAPGNTYPATEIKRVKIERTKK